MYGLPPTPPRTGCFGIVIDPSASAITTSTVVVSMCSCVPLTLLRKINCVETSPSRTMPERVTWGPGLFVQSRELPDSETAASIARDCCTVTADAPVDAAARSPATSATRIVPRVRLLFNIGVSTDGRKPGGVEGRSVSAVIVLQGVYTTGFDRGLNWGAIVDQSLKENPPHHGMRGEGRAGRASGSNHRRSAS